MKTTKDAFDNGVGNERIR